MMPAPNRTSLVLLKGKDFIARLEEVCRHRPKVNPLPCLKYRRILIPGMVGGEDQFALLGFIGEALRMRGAEVTGLCCDKFLPACVCRKVDHHESACTRWCHKNIGPFMRTLGLPHRWYSEFISKAEMQECARLAAGVQPDQIPGFRWRDIELGEHILRSIENYYKVGRLDLDNPEMVAKSKDFVLSAMYLTITSERVLDELQIDKVFVNDGKKNNWGIIRSVAFKKGIPVDVSLYGPRGRSVTFERDHPPVWGERLPQWQKWRETPLDQAQESALAEYFDRRATAPFAGRSSFEHTRRIPHHRVRSMIGLPNDVTGKVFGMFPNLSYDGGLTSNKPALLTTAEWVANTISYYANRPEHRLVVKIHPGEKFRIALDPTMDFLKQRFETFPANVHVIPPATPATAHDVVHTLDIVMVYTSTVTIEAAVFGKPVVMVGGGRHGGKGITIDATTPEQYFKILDELCDGPTPAPPPNELARRYAYATFFRTILPVTHFSTSDLRLTSINLGSLDDIAPGCDPTIDLICRGILYDEPIELEYWPEGR